MSELAGYVGQFDIAVRVTSGGYVGFARAWNTEDAEAEFTSCVFTDPEALAEWMKRIVTGLEGSPELKHKLGPLRIGD